jgi:FimV-like protein
VDRTSVDLQRPDDTGIGEQMTLPPLEPVTISEVGTKLDLARAYMDMGDPDGARNILKEVLQEGSVGQKQEAQRLIDSLPG